MQAVILAGGFGTRLRPLTYTRPKSLLPLLNKPMVLHVFERLPADVDEVLIPANYGVEQLEAFFRREDVGRRVTVVHERTPLDTGGALKTLEDRLHRTFLAFNGDVVASLDVSDLLDAHRRHGGIGTVALWEVHDPSAYGVVSLDGDRITKFVEKPSKPAAGSSLVNAGAYVFEPEFLAAIPDGKVSLERDVFPRVTRKGLYGHRFTGYWSDVGTLDNFLRATTILLHHAGGEVSRTARLGRTAKVVPPVAIAAGDVVDGEVGPVVTLGRNCVVGEARLANCVLFDRVTVRDGAMVSGSVVGEGCEVGRRATVSDSILGDGVSVADGQQLRGERVRA